VVNFHLTPAWRHDEYDRQFSLYAKYFSSATEEDLDAFLRTGRWHKAKPGLIPAFYNGYRNNYDVALPLLEQHGLIGWFFVVTGFIDAADQNTYAATQGITPATDERGDGRIALSWDEVRTLSHAHVVASHTRAHTQAAASEGHEDAALGSQEDFRREISRPVQTIAWAGGAAYGEHPEADQAVVAAGFRFIVSNFRMQRLSAEPF
jgi:peptidoglycan/xylan/chitin deacetylase (PgdA/CDA1 family)